MTHLLAKYFLEYLSDQKRDMISLIRCVRLRNYELSESSELNKDENNGGHLS